MLKCIIDPFSLYTSLFLDLASLAPPSTSSSSSSSTLPDAPLPPLSPSNLASSSSSSSAASSPANRMRSESHQSTDSFVWNVSSPLPNQQQPLASPTTSPSPSRTTSSRDLSSFVPVAPRSDELQLIFFFCLFTFLFSSISAVLRHYWQPPRLHQLQRPRPPLPLYPREIASFAIVLSFTFRP